MKRDFLMLDDFLLRAALGGLMVALVAGPFGCFVVWQRMAYFGDALAHSALLGIALGSLWQMPPLAGVMIVCVAIGLAVSWQQYERHLALDTTLGILAHAALAFGMLALAFAGPASFNLTRALFGDILTVSWNHLAMMAAAAAPALGFLLFFWNDLLAMTINRSLAAAEGVRVQRLNLGFILALALVVAVTMQVVGILLTTALLIIPAAGARSFARSPEAMAAGAVIIGILSVAIGLAVSWRWDTPAGPAMVAAATLVFLLTRLGKRA